MAARSTKDPDSLTRLHHIAPPTTCRKTAGTNRPLSPALLLVTGARGRELVMAWTAFTTAADRHTKPESRGRNREGPKACGC